MSKKQQRLETMAVQGAYEPANGEPRVVPLALSTTYAYDSAKDIADLFDLKTFGHFYTRLSNPTVAAFEAKVRPTEKANKDLPFATFAAMSELIQELAKLNPCIFLGRCAGHVLKSAGVPYLRVFIYASDMNERIRRVREVDGVEENRIEAAIRKKDNQRRNYNKFFTQETWGDRQNYDLMINTSTMGYEGAAKLILAAMA